MVVVAGIHGGGDGRNPTQQSCGIFLANSVPRHTSVNKIGQKLDFGPNWKNEIS